MVRTGVQRQDGEGVQQIPPRELLPREEGRQAGRTHDRSVRKSQRSLIMAACVFRHVAHRLEFHTDNVDVDGSIPSMPTIALRNPVSTADELLRPTQ